MAQFEASINCPFCGQRVIVYCPKIEAVPRKVIGAEGYFTYADSGDIQNYVPCGNCGKEICVLWFF